MVDVVVATLNVSFDGSTDGTGGTLKLEIDDREDGGNGGETSFKPGDTPVFFEFIGQSVTKIGNPKSSSGSVAVFPPGVGEKDIDENITFSNSNSGSLGYPPKPGGTVELKWLGRSYTLTGTTLSGPPAPIPDRNDDQLTIPGGKNAIGILNAKYKSEGKLWQLKSADMPEVIIFSIGTVGIP